MENPYKHMWPNAISGGMRKAQRKAIADAYLRWEKEHGTPIRPPAQEPEGLAFYCRCGTVTYAPADTVKITCKKCGHSI